MSTTTCDPIAVLSYGGGLDSWTMLLEGVRRGERIDLVIFADVGDCDDRSTPGEWPGTLQHIAEVARPFAAAHGIEWVTLDANNSQVRGHRSLYAYAIARKMLFGAMSHLCTIAGKIDRIADYLDGRYPDRDVEVWIGFDASETARAERDPRGPNAVIKHRPGRARRRSRYPLVEWQLCRCREEQIARESGLPVPRKSACVFCPKASRNDYATLARELPTMFSAVEAYERNAKLTKAGKLLKIAGTGDDAAWLGDWARGRRADGSPMRPFRYQAKPCLVCGAEQRATKATGCGYLSDAAELAA